jgi:hypothetical protein
VWAEHLPAGISFGEGTEMPEEIGLYYFDGSPEATGQLATLRQLFDNEYWTVLQWPDASTAPHFNMRVNFTGAGPISPAPPPAMAYLVRALSTRPISDAALAAVAAIFSSVAPHVRDQTISSLSVILPDQRRIRFDAGGTSLAALSDEDGAFDEYIVPLDATERDIAALQLIQDLEYSFDTRIKFASVDSKGRYRSDALEEYDSFLDGLPPGWRREPGNFQIGTRSEGSRQAWHLRSKDELDVAVVEHETGVEILLFVAAVVVAPVAINVASSAIYDLSKWGLNKWLHGRQGKASKHPTFLEIERVRKDAGGNALGSEVIRVRAPVDDQALRSTVERLLQAGASGAVIV